MRLGVTAIPDRMALGQSSQLEATVEGGAPPYTFDWIPVESVDDSTIHTPVATPVVTTIYEVTVIDSGNNAAVDTVTVTIDMELDVTATPDTIDGGETAQLNVTVAGGKPPYTYLWDPADGLDPADASLADSVVAPGATQTYTVTVTDAVGEIMVGTVQVTANQTDLAACFEVTPDPPSMGPPNEVWDAGCSSGTGLEYRWVFSIEELGSCYDMCFGAGASPDGTMDSPCSLFDFSPDLEVLT